MSVKIKQIIVGPISANCYVFVSGDELAIIDPGDEAEKILQEIRKISAKPKYIINTHYHFDHTSANQEVKEATGAKILIHQAEKNFINFPVDQFLKDDDEIKIGETALKVIHTPGHTAGSICLLGQNFIFTGDTLFVDGPGRTDLPGGSLESQKLSLEKLAKIIKPEMTVYPGHGQIFKKQCL